MTRDEAEGMAAEYVLGTLDGNARKSFAQALAGDPALQKLVEDWEVRLGTLSAAVPAASPPETLWDGISARLTDPQDTVPGTTTLRAEQGAWVSMGEGMQMKLLSVDRVSRRRSFLVRVAQGAHYRAHAHSQTEECLMLEGELSFGDLTLKAGDYHIIEPGFEHPEAYSETGCTLFIRGELRDAA